MDMPTKPRVTPKDFFLWVGGMAALYASVVSFITLIFQYIDYAFPDALQYYVDPYQGPIRFALASLIVVFPTFLVLMRFIRRAIATDPSRGDVWVRRWALFLTLFIAGVTIVIDLITLVNTFLGGDLSTRFLLKVVVVFLVVGAGFLHFLADLRGYWIANPAKARLVGYGAALAILVSIAGGFFIIGTPGEARLYRFDDQKVSDLQNIQWQVVNFYQQKGKLPVASKELEDPISGFVLPKDPQSAQDYGYRITKAPYSFELCAEFNKESRDASSLKGPAVPAGTQVHVGGSLENPNWSHGPVSTCFERTIDPERYPLIKK